jgi:toxin YoeB
LTKKGRQGGTGAKREAVFHAEFREDLEYWVKTDRKIALRVLTIVEDVLRDPFQGIGKPEPLEYLAEGAWSRRLTREHRVVYQVRQGRVDFLQCRYHY